MGGASPTFPPPGQATREIFQDCADLSSERSLPRVSGTEFINQLYDLQRTDVAKAFYKRDEYFYLTYDFDRSLLIYSCVFQYQMLGRGNGI